MDYEIELAEQSLLSLSSAVSAPMALGPFPHGWKTGSFWEHSPLIMSFYISAQAGQKGAILKSRVNGCHPLSLSLLPRPFQVGLHDFLERAGPGS